MSKIETLFMFMLDGKEKTSLDIRNEINTVASGSMIGDLRKLGCDISCYCVSRSATGAMIYAYTLLSFPQGTFGVGE